MQSAQYLTQKWFELNYQAASAWPERPGTDCVANFEVVDVPLVASGPENPDSLLHKVPYYMVICNGRLVEIAAGKLADANVGIVYKYADAKAEISNGDHPDLAYMTGRMKLDGDYACWVFGLRALLNSAEHATYRSHLAQHTNF